MIALKTCGIEADAVDSLRGEKKRMLVDSTPRYELLEQDDHPNVTKSVRVLRMYHVRDDK